MAASLKPQKNIDCSGLSPTAVLRESSTRFWKHPEKAQNAGAGLVASDRSVRSDAQNVTSSCSYLQLFVTSSNARSAPFGASLLLESARAT